MLKFPFVGLLILFFAPMLQGQTNNSVFGFLDLPVSSHVSALGGNNVSLVDDDISLVYHNPALLGAEVNKHLGLGYMNYMSGVHVANAIYGQTQGEKGTWAVGVRYIDYGSVTQTGESGEVLGSFSMKDLAAQASYSYDLTDRLRGGASFKVIYSNYEQYTSLALGADLGLSYFDEEHDFSAGLTFRNWGAQVKAYNDTYEKMPWDILIGITKKLGHAPLRFSVTMQNLLDWEMKSSSNNGSTEKDSFGNVLWKHFVLGLDIVPNDNFYVGVGYNPKRGDDYSLTDSKGLAGFSLGAGIKTGRFQIHVSWSQYQIAGSSIMAGLSYNFGASDL